MRTLVIVSALILAGCTSVPEPAPIGPDTYKIAFGSPGIFSNNEQLLAESIKKAHEFCAAKGLRVGIIKTQSSQGSQRLASQKNQVVFTCLAIDNPTQK